MRTRRIRVFREIVIAPVSSLVLFFSLSIEIVNAQAGQVTLKPSDDTFVDSSFQTSTFGEETLLAILNEYHFFAGQFYTIEELVWLKFNLPSCS